MAWRAGRRWVRRLERVALPPVDASRLPLRRRGHYLITGGLGGLGLAFARWLGERFGARLLLTARTVMPPREQWDDALAQHGDVARHHAAIAAIRAIEAAGGEVMVAAADASDERAMAQAIAGAASRFGPLHGVIHAAGIAGGGSIALVRAPGAALEVLAPKVRGLEVLVRLLGDTPLDIVALMSSINAVIGAPGTCVYASANAFLDAFAESTLRPAAWKQVVAFDWSAWREVGMAAKLAVPAAQQAQWQAYLASAIATAEGVDAFARGLASGRPRLVVAPYDLEQLMQERRLHPAPASETTAAPQTAANTQPSAASGTSVQRPELACTFEAPRAGIEQRIASIWTELLGIDGVGVHDDFFELGGHSLLATRVIARIEQTAGVRLALRDIFDAPTVRRLAERIDAARAAHGVQGAPDGEREEIEF